MPKVLPIRSPKWRRASWVCALASAAILALAPLASAESDNKPDGPHKKEAPTKVLARSRPEPVQSDPEITTASFGDWVERCQRLGTAADAAHVCEVAETIRVEGQNAPIAELAIGRTRRGEPMRLTLLLPVNVAFPSVPKVAVGPARAVELAWRRCIPGGCIADAAISDDDLTALRAAAEGGQLQSKSSLGQDLSLPVSFRGLAQSLDALSHEN